MRFKKGVISIQLNWIFVMIIGAIILIFFITIVQKQKEYSEENIAGAIQTDLQAIFSSSHVSTGTSSIIEVPNQDINFNCEGFKIGKQFPAHYPYAFAPDLIKSDRNTISVYAYDWSVPYRVTNFLYVTSPDVRYIIQGTDQDLINALEEILPPRYIIKDGKSSLFMNRGTDLDGNYNNYKVRIIYLNNDPGTFQEDPDDYGIKANDLSAVSIQPSCGNTAEEKLDCNGDLKFYNYNGEDWPGEPLEFIGKASILAAIFAENQKIYECGMENAFERLEKVTQIYITRTSNLVGCDIQYSDAESSLISIASAATTPDYTLISTAAENLESTNDDLLANSCPPIY